jgi:hypothetical protein
MLCVYWVLVSLKLGLTREHTVIGTKRVSVTGALPMCCRNNLSVTKPITSNIPMRVLTIIPTLGAREIFLEIWAWIILLVLSAVSTQESVVSILFLGLLSAIRTCTRWGWT